MSDSEPKPNDCGPVVLTVRGELGAKILRRCHDEGVSANDATEIIWRRQLQRAGSIVGADGQETTE